MNRRKIIIEIEENDNQLIKTKSSKCRFCYECCKSYHVGPYEVETYGIKYVYVSFPAGDITYMRPDSVRCLECNSFVYQKAINGALKSAYNIG